MPNQFGHDPSLIVIRCAQNCMQDGDQRFAKLAQEAREIGSRRTAIKPEFVLQENGIDKRGVQILGGVGVRPGILLFNFQMGWQL